MKIKKSTKTILGVSCVVAAAVSLSILGSQKSPVQASSHREAPLIANDPLADNTDLYVFRSPDDTNKVTIVANYVPLQLPQGGPNYSSFGTNIRYEIHIENNGAAGDDITYRFTFSKTDQDTTTFFNIRLGKENLKTTFLAEKSINSGPFTTIVPAGTVPPPNIGPRSISNATVGLGASSYNALMLSAVANASGGGGEKIYCGPADDPFFADLGGIFDVGQTRMTGTAKDGVGKKNVHSIVIQAPISTFQKAGLSVSSATNILDGNFVIGVWASASRPTTRTLSSGGANPNDAGSYVQVSRLGMPLTNEAIIPIGSKDRWNSRTPYTEITSNENFFCNPELGLYMDDSQYGGAVPALTALRTQSASLGSYDFRNGKQGLYPLYATNAGVGTALDTNTYGKYLLRANKPRSVDILPIFYTGVPNLRPYQLATGKPANNPLAAGKPFINNWMPIFGDMLRLNMAVPVTPRTDPNFSTLGLVQAAVIGLTNPSYSTTALQFIPNMDGFPNGRRLEDDVTRIELQAVSGVVLAAIGLWCDDYTGVGSPVTPKLVGVLSYSTGVQNNDTTFKANFPYVQSPWSGYANHSGQ
ncbi:MAG: DUF4331 domain-containing protein [Bacteroidia bacterium]